MPHQLLTNGTIHSSCLMTCSVDCVTTRPKILRNSNCTRDRTRAGPEKNLSRPTMSAWRVSKRATPEGDGSSVERSSKLPKNGGKGSTRASDRLAASCEDSLGRSIVALEKLSLKHDQEIRELAGALTDFWLAPKTLRAAKAGIGSRSGLHGGSQEERKRARAGSAIHATWRRRSWRHSQSRQKAPKASADDIRGARSGGGRKQ